MNYFYLIAGVIAIIIRLLIKVPALRTGFIVSGIISLIGFQSNLLSIAALSYIMILNSYKNITNITTESIAYSIQTGFTIIAFTFLIPLATRNAFQLIEKKQPAFQIAINSAHQELSNNQTPLQQKTIDKELSQSL